MINENSFHLLDANTNGFKLDEKSVLKDKPLWQQEKEDNQEKYQA